jgi:lipoyl(octanoyl) transferase
MNAVNESSQDDSNRPGILLTYHEVGYEEGWSLQRRLVEERLAERRLDTLVLLEHPPVYTIGRTGRPEHWGGNDASLQASGIAVHHVERGGSITYHGPGQVVGYPVLRLADYCPGPKRYMHLLEEVLIRTLADWGLKAMRRDRLTGVWVEHAGPAKIGAMGVRIIRGITMHGFALNVHVELTPFRRIAPCGLTGCRVTSMAELLAIVPDITEVKRRLADHFCDVFGITWQKAVADTDVAPDVELSMTVPFGSSTSQRTRRS